MATLLSSLGIIGFPAPGAAFEFKPHNVENTHFDFMLPLQSPGPVYFEVKYTEAGFGVAKPDSEHLWKFYNVYKPRLADRFEKSFCCYSLFLKNYQIMRNVWHLDRDKDDIVVFLFPKSNEELRRKEVIINSCALEPFRSRIKIIYIEDLVTALGRELRRTNAGKEAFLVEFCRKYFP